MCRLCVVRASFVHLSVFAPVPVFACTGSAGPNRFVPAADMPAATDGNALVRSGRLGTAGRRAIERHATCVRAMNTPGSVPEYQGKHRQTPCRKVRLRATLAEADAARWLQRGKPRRPMRDAAFPGMPSQTGDGIEAKGKRTVRISNRYCFSISALMRMKCIRKGIRKSSHVGARMITEHLRDRVACRVQPALHTIRIEIRYAMILRKLPQVVIASACFMLSTR